MDKKEALKKIKSGDISLEDAVFKANGGIFGGINLMYFNYLLNTLIYSLTETSPPV